METMLSFILKSGIALLVLYLFYYALLRNETNFRFNRLYLLLAPVVALSLPLVKWPALFSPDTAIAQTLQAIQLSEVTVTGYRQPATDTALLEFITPASLAWCIYLLVALFLVFRLYRQLWHIRNLISRAISVQQQPGPVQILQMEQHFSSFAFLNYVFLSKQEQLSPREKQQVLAHELAHVQLGHTYDILFYELLSILLWFHPVIWFLKAELRNLHEYQADARVLEQHQPQEYSALLSKEVLFNMGLPVGSHFQKPQVLQRLQMLKLHGKQAGWLKPLLSLPLLVLLLFTLTSHRATTDIASQLATTTKETPAPQKPPLQELAPGTVESKGETPTPEPTKRMPDTMGEPPEDVPAQGTEPTDKVQDLLHTKPYTYVEQMPQFRGGESEMLKYLGENIRYPKEAQEAKVEGLVVVRFTINYNGSLEDIEVIKKLGKGTDEEAIRVVKMMNGSWEPGRQNGKVVPVQYTLPIRFALR
ncbi:M56 family metallopeptidase [Pontibacter brevis]